MHSINSQLKERMEGEAAAAVLQVLVQNLIDHSKKEISLIRGLDKEAEKLTGTLHTVQKFLNDAETRSIHGEAVRSWLKKLENFAFDADNVLDELNYHLLSKKIKTLKPIKQKVLSYFSSSNRKMAHKIKEINENLDSINKEAADLGLVERLADAPTLLDSGFETDSFSVDPIFIGRDDAVSEIVDILTSVITSDERLVSVVSIVGMGGMGKTTLTRKVFNHQTMKPQFGLFFWVHVSRNFDPLTLFKKILKELGVDEVESRQDVLKRLQETLKDKTYLLVLDDVWNQDLRKWEDFMNSLLGVTSTKGNAIVVTTRSLEVASIVNPLHMHKLEGLSEEDCWSIIKAKTFGTEEVIPSELETIGRKIARRCHGLPLAANVVGGVLRNKSKEKWVSIQENWLSRDDGENITKILRLSFDNLSPPSLKKCFAYCSVFSKGHKMIKQDLIEYWMAEGFLQSNENDDVVSVGDGFINMLLHNSLLQVAERDDYGNVSHCVMHDLVHDLASSVLGTSNIADGISRARYMVLEDESSPLPKEVAKYLRTLFSQGDVSSTKFSDFEHLHVLTLASYGLELMPNSVRKLIHLRNLNISGTSIENLPEWIGELHHLQILRAETRYLRELPSTIKYLTNLRHLYVDYTVNLPPEIGRLTSLQTLRHFRIGNCKIEVLGSLNNLRGKLRIDNLELVLHKEEAEKAYLFKKSKILELWYGWIDTREDERNNDEDVLEGLQPHPNLKKLEINGFKGRRFPSWTMKMAVVGNVGQGSWLGLNNLTEIRLIRCSRCEEIPMLGHLPTLKSLRLQELNNVKCINSSFYGMMKEETRIVFPALRRLELVDMPQLAEWAQVEFAEGADEVIAFPELQHLGISFCKRLMSVPTHFSPCLIRLVIRDNGVECLPDCIFINNPNLSELEIEKCPNLRELPRGLERLKSLEKLIISECPNLENIATDQSQAYFTSLHRVSIRMCHALVYLPCEMVGSSLEILSLVELTSLKNLPSLIDCLGQSPRLKELTIVGVPNFTASSSSLVEIRPTFHSLTSIHIDASIGGSSSGSMETVEGILQVCCHSLKWLRLKGMEVWQSLPQSIQHLVALYLLDLGNFGIEELPNWLGNLSSLKELTLHNCKRLRLLPSVDAMRRLPRFKDLTIYNCPELRIERQDPGWLLVASNYSITIDGRLMIFL